MVKWTRNNPMVIRRYGDDIKIVGWYVDKEMGSSGCGGRVVMVYRRM